VKQELFRIYRDENDDFIFWMEQMRLPELRHPAFQLEGDEDEQWRRLQARPGWGEAPAVIVALADGRRQWTTVMGAHTFGRHQSHLTDGLATACMLMHCAAAALGLGTQWVTIHVEEAFKRALGVPDVLSVYQIIPVGYPDGATKKSGRRRLNEIVHHDVYDRGKFLSNRAVVEHVRSTRVKTASKYLKAEEAPE
jgi:nitroreductase